LQNLIKKIKAQRKKNGYRPDPIGKIHETKRRKEARYHRVRWSWHLAHLTALDAVRAALAALFTDEATAQSSQAGAKAALALAATAAAVVLLLGLLVLHRLLLVALRGAILSGRGTVLSRRRTVSLLRVTTVSLGRRRGAAVRGTLMIVIGHIEAKLVGREAEIGGEEHRACDRNKGLD
jgi:hypothetical protein